MGGTDFLTKVRATLSRHCLVAPGERVVVGLSGGADSCALLLALAAFADEFEFSLHAAHLNHRLRGDASRTDQEFCRSLAAELGVGFSAREADVSALSSSSRLSLEETGRRARLEFFSAVREAQSAERVAVGHTLDDLTETFFLNLFRGAGLDGLVALRPKRDEWLIRPLLDCTHEETESFCHSRGIVWREDESNRDTRFARNHIRWDLLPLIREQFCPALADRLRGLSEILREERDYLEDATRELLSLAARETEDGGLELDGASLSAAPPALARRALRAAVATVRGSRHNVSLDHIDHCLSLLREPRGSREVSVPGVWCLVESGRRVLVLPGPRVCDQDESLARLRIRLAVPGETPVAPLGISIHVRAMSAADVEPSTDARSLAMLDADQVGDQLWVRAPRPGDRFRPLGLGGSKKLSDLLIDAKVPRAVRARLPVIENERHVVWAVGHLIDDRAKLTPRTRRVLRIEARPA